MWAGGWGPVLLAGAARDVRKARGRLDGVYLGDASMHDGARCAIIDGRGGCDGGRALGGRVYSAAGKLPVVHTLSTGTACTTTVAPAPLPAAPAPAAPATTTPIGSAVTVASAASGFAPKYARYRATSSSLLPPSGWSASRSSALSSWPFSLRWRVWLGGGAIGRLRCYGRRAMRPRCTIRGV